MTTWTAARRASAASRRVASRPSTPGIWMSTRDVGQVLDGERDACLAVGGLGDDLDVVLGVQEGPEAAADQGLVVDEQDSDHCAGTSAVGRSARTRKPPVARGSAPNVPPRAVTRSRMPMSPTPGTGG